MRSLRGALTRDNICWIIRDVQRTCKNMRSTKPHNLRPKKQNKKTLKSTSTANRHRASSTSSSTTREVGGGGGGEKESEHTFPVCDPQPGTKIMQEGIVRFLSRSSSPPSFGVQSHWGSGHLITHPKHPDRTSPRRCDIGRGGPVIPPMGPSQPLLQKTLHRATPNKPPYHLQPKPLFLHLRRRDNRSNHSNNSQKPTTPLPNSSPATPKLFRPSHPLRTIPSKFPQFLPISPDLWWWCFLLTLRAAQTLLVARRNVSTWGGCNCSGCDTRWELFLGCGVFASVASGGWLAFALLVCEAVTPSPTRESLQPLTRPLFSFLFSSPLFSWLCPQGQSLSNDTPTTTYEGSMCYLQAFSHSTSTCGKHRSQYSNPMIFIII